MKYEPLNEALEVACILKSRMNNKERTVFDALLDNAYICGIRDTLDDTIGDKS